MKYSTSLLFELNPVTNKTIYPIQVAKMKSFIEFFINFNFPL